MGWTVSTMAHEMAGASIAPQGQAGTAKAAPGTGLCSSQRSCSFVQHFAHFQPDSLHLSGLQVGLHLELGVVQRPLRPLLKMAAVLHLEGVSLAQDHVQLHAGGQRGQDRRVHAAQIIWQHHLLQHGW